MANIALSIHKFHLPKSREADGYFGGDLVFKNIGEGYVLDGNINVDKLNITIPEKFQSKIPELNIVEKKVNTDSEMPADIALNININAPQKIFVRGWGLDAEFGGNINVSGDVSHPVFDGSLSAKRGRYEEFGKRFTFDKANLRFQGAVPPSPYLDVNASVPAGDVVASILMNGSVTGPKISFSSVPSLPQDEILSRILFGRTTDKISPFQAVQLAQALRRFSGNGGGGFNPMQMLRSATGLDDISVETDSNGETTVGVGKYLTDKAYMEFEKGKAENSGAANIQIELTPNINIQSKIGADAQAGGGVFWKKDY